MVRAVSLVPVETDAPHERGCFRVRQNDARAVEHQIPIASNGQSIRKIYRLSIPEICASKKDSGTNTY